MARPPVRFTGIHGTMMRDAPWVKPDSDLVKFLATYNISPLTPDDPFVWSGDVNGWQFWRRFGIGATGGDCEDWEVGGNALRWKLIPVPYQDRGLLVHSHGLWPAIEAMAQGLTVPWMMSVGSPIREDMEDRIKQALPNLGAWLHVYDPHFDWWGMLGSFGDGKFNWNRAQRYAGPPHKPGTSVPYMALFPRRGGNDAIRGIGHSGPLVDRKWMDLFFERKWLDFMAPAPVVTPV